MILLSDSNIVTKIVSYWNLEFKIYVINFLSHRNIIYYLQLFIALLFNFLPKIINLFIMTYLL